jgi:hypothetical protein
MPVLHYDRVEKHGDAAPEVVRAFSTPIHQAPAMPDSVRQTSDNCWQRVIRGERMVVIQTWRIFDGGFATEAS